MMSLLCDQFIQYICSLIPAKKFPSPHFYCVSEIPIDEIPANLQESLFVARMLEICCHTHWVTVLVVNSNC